MINFLIKYIFRFACRLGYSFVWEAKGLTTIQYIVALSSLFGIRTVRLFCLRKTLKLFILKQSLWKIFNWFLLREGKISNWTICIEFQRTWLLYQETAHLNLVIYMGMIKYKGLGRSIFIWFVLQKNPSLIDLAQSALPTLSINFINYSLHCLYLKLYFSGRSDWYDHCNF